jgi:NADH dehydrogenase
VVIAGAGYAGISALLALAPAARKQQLGLTLINRSDAHLLLPELPLFLAGEEGREDVRLSLSALVRPPLRLVLAHVESIAASPPQVHCAGPAGTITADGLVVALGAVPADFGVPGVQAHAIAVGRWADAVELRRRMLRDLRQRAGGTVVVVGGGATGVEVASELASVRGARERVTLLAPRLLPGMPPPVRTIARRALGRLGVQLVAGRAAEVRADGVLLPSGQHLAADTVVWAAGHRANPALRTLPHESHGRGRVLVDATLRVAAGVYAAGDGAAVHDARSGRPVAATAQAAVAQGELAAQNLLRALRGERGQPYHDRSWGQLVSLGRGEAVGLIGRHVVQGREVAALKELVAAYHTFQVGGIRALGFRLRRAVEEGGDLGARRP